MGDNKPKETAAPEPKRNARKAMAFLIECDEDGLWTMTHCRPDGTDIAKAIKGAAKHPTSSRDGIAMASALVGKAIFGYQDGAL